MYSLRALTPTHPPQVDPIVRKLRADGMFPRLLLSKTAIDFEQRIVLRRCALGWTSHSTRRNKRSCPISCVAAHLSSAITRWPFVLLADWAES